MGITHTSVLRKLRAKAQSWGGDIKEVSPNEFASIVGPEISDAPFTMWDICVNHKEKTVYFSKHNKPKDVASFATGLLHEMGHTFACKDVPDEADEFDFLGWEFSLAKEIGVPQKLWLKGNKDYQVDDRGTDIADYLRRSEGLNLKRLLKDIVKRSTKCSLIKHGKAVSIRS